MGEPTKTLLISINSSWNIVHFRGALLAALRRDGYRLISAAPDDDYTPSLRTMVDMHTRLPMHAASISPIHDAMLFLRYMYLLYRTKPSALLTYTIKPNIYGALAARIMGIPVIVNISGLGSAFLRNDWLTRLVHGLYRIALRRHAYVFFQNPEDADVFIKHGLIKPNQAHMLHGSGVDLEYYHPHHNHSAGASVRFVMIARLLKDKGVVEFAEAARMVKARYPDVTFHLVGQSGAPNPSAISLEIIREWEAGGMLSYLGPSDDIRGVMASHDCVVLPSYREGLSRVLLEASAMGKPMITCDVAGCRQVVTHQQNGLLCAPQNAQSLADAMLAFLALTQEQRQQMGEASRAKAEQLFGEAHIIHAYREALAQLT